MSSDRLRITYVLTCADGEDPQAKARDIALEQTVELPPGAFSSEIGERIVGKVEALVELERPRWRVVLSYDVGVVGDDIPQLLNLVFGNISLKAGIRVTAIELPPSLLAHFPGPRFGIEGLRQICGPKEGKRRPLICGALKPLGLSAERLAEICHQFALGGIDIVKDDHGLVNQRTAPFRERVQRCQEAVAQANRVTGGNTVYFPNLMGSASGLGKRLEFVSGAGCRGVLLSPLLMGLDTVRWVAETSELAILAHPALSGVFFHPGHGIAPEVMLGQIFRVIGSDGVIYPNVGGRFAFAEATCDAINANLRQPLASLRPSFPVPGGGIDVAEVPRWTDRYGVDTIFLIGSSFYAQSDVAGAVRRLLDAVRRHGDERSFESH